MNTHTQPLSILSAFWRRGRQTFVPLTIRELIHQHGATAHEISAMVAVGFIRREETTKDTETVICTITEAGRRLVPQLVAEPKAKRPAAPANLQKAAPVTAPVQDTGFRVPNDVRQVYAGKPAYSPRIVAAMNALAKHERRKGWLPNNKGAEAAENGALGGNRPETPATLAMKLRRRRMRALRAINGKALAASTVAVQAGFHKSEATAACEWLVEQGHASTVTKGCVTRYTATPKGIEQLRREDERK